MIKFRSWEKVTISYRKVLEEVTDDYQMKLIGKKMKLIQMILPAFVEYIGNVHANPELLKGRF